MKAGIGYRWSRRPALVLAAVLVLLAAMALPMASTAAAAPSQSWGIPPTLKPSATSTSAAAPALISR
ncbi:MAG: hypothetical protein V9H69_19950 [Anaerolineae bacterium]